MKIYKKFFQKVLALTLISSMMTGFSITAFAADKTLQQDETLYHGLSFEEELAEAETVLDLGDITNRTTNLVLPYSYATHINIVWESSDESVIDLKGKVILPTDTDKDVTLTATFSSTKISDTKTKKFTVHVPKATTADILARDAKDAQEYIDYILNTGYKLPSAEEIGIRSEIKWELTSGEAEIKDGKLVKTEQSAERQPVELKATLTYEGETKETICSNLTLLDEYVGYILSYFGGKEESKDMYLGYSYDGVHWMRLNKADKILSSTMGDKEIRDPYIMRKKDGSFAIICTDGWNGPHLSIWDSEDLVTFENERRIKMIEKSGMSENGYTGYHTWAPECTYDPIQDLYTMYWSDPKGHNLEGQTYYATSSDLLTFSQHGNYFEREFKIIDASIKKYKGDYYMVYQDMTGDNEETTLGRRIYVAKSDTLEPGSFYPYSGCISGPVAEGGFLLQNYETGSFQAYYDFYQKHKFGVSTIEDITTDDWVYQGISETMPWDEIRHGGALPVTEKESKAILAKWKLEEPEIISSNENESVTAYVGDTGNDLKLPKIISVTLADGSVKKAGVTWNTDNISFNEIGLFEITGTFDSKDYPVKEGATATLSVNIVKKPVTSPIALIGVGVLVITTVGVTFLIIRKKKVS